MSIWSRIKRTSHVVGHYVNHHLGTDVKHLAKHVQHTANKTLVSSKHAIQHVSTFVQKDIFHSGVVRGLEKDLVKDLDAQAVLSTAEAPLVAGGIGVLGTVVVLGITAGVVLLA